MNKKEILEKMNEIGNRCTQEIGYELVEIVMNKKADPQEIDFIVFHPQGVKIDDCAQISRAISSSLDELDLFEGAYQLQVSSPGLDRPIKSMEDLRRNKGKLVEAHLYSLFKGKKHYQGILSDFDYESITLKLDNEEECIIPKSSLSLLRQAIIF